MVSMCVIIKLLIPVVLLSESKLKEHVGVGWERVKLDTRCSYSLGIYRAACMCITEVNPFRSKFEVVCGGHRVQTKLPPARRELGSLTLTQ